MTIVDGHFLSNWATRIRTLRCWSQRQGE